MNILVKCAPFWKRSCCVFPRGVAVGENSWEVGSAPPSTISWSSVRTKIIFGHVLQGGWIGGRGGGGGSGAGAGGRAGSAEAGISNSLQCCAPGSEQCPRSILVPFARTHIPGCSGQKLAAIWPPRVVDSCHAKWFAVCTCSRSLPWHACKNTRFPSVHWTESSLRQNCCELHVAVASQPPFAIWGIPRASLLTLHKLSQPVMSLCSQDPSLKGACSLE